MEILVCITWLPSCILPGILIVEPPYEVFCRAIGVWLLLGLALGFSYAESNSKLTGAVIDPSDRPVPGAPRFC